LFVLVASRLCSFVRFLSSLFLSFLSSFFIYSSFIFCLFSLCICTFFPSCCLSPRCFCLFSLFYSEGKRPLGRPRRRWEDGIIMDLREIGLGGVDWIQLAEDRDQWRAVVSAVMNLRVLAPRS
jgi:hypothetical protein